MIQAYAGRQKIEKGTEVVIKAMGMTVKGTVLTADNWETAEAPNWYIELTDTKGQYRYWKQKYDGGQLVEVNGVKVVHLAK